MYSAYQKAANAGAIDLSAPTAITLRLSKSEK